MHVVGPEISLASGHIPYCFKPFEWQVDLESRLALHSSGLVFALRYDFDIGSLGRTTTPPDIYAVTVRLTHVCDDRKVPSPQRVAELGREAILCFLLNADIWAPEETDQPDRPPRNPRLRPPRDDDFIPF